MFSEKEERNPESDELKYEDPAKPRIEFNSVIKIYKTGKIEVVALRGLSCKIHSGEITVIMGPSGCGKTTLLNLIGGLDRPSSGKILVDNENIVDYSDKELEKYRKNKIGYVFQFMNLIPELTAAENIGLPLLLNNISLKDRDKRIKDLLDVVGLSDRSQHKPDELSGGEQQRIAIAAAMANDPEILLCDEPTGELDTNTKIQIMKLFRNIIQKYPAKVIIIVTHDLDMKQVADRLFYIRDGQISHELNKEQLSKDKKDIDESSKISSEAPKKVLEELRELEYIIKNKINKLENQL